MTDETTRKKMTDIQKQIAYLRLKDKRLGTGVIADTMERDEVEVLLEAEFARSLPENITDNKKTANHPSCHQTSQYEAIEPNPHSIRTKKSGCCPRGPF